MPRPKTNREPFTLFILPALKQKLRLQAAIDGVSMSHIVERALRKELNDTPTLPPTPEKDEEE
jgi:hypothetical protein